MHKLILFGGKGGVGKTTMAAATALQMSQEKKVLILSTDPAHSLSDSFEVEIGKKITSIKKNLDGLEIDAASLLVEYKKKYGGFLKQIAEEGTFFGKDDINKFFDLSLPGMDELIALLKIIDILEEDTYDAIIVDTAPTGHTIRLLEMPELLTKYVEVLIAMRRKHRVVVKMMTKRYVKDEADAFIDKMNNDILRIKSILQDAAKTSFRVVMIPEAMSVYETEKLVGVLEKHNIAMSKIIVNNVMKNGTCDLCQLQSESQEKYVSQIKKKFGKDKIIEVPLFAQAVTGKRLEIVSNVLSQQTYTLPPHPKVADKKKVSFAPLSVTDSTSFLLFGGKGGVGKTSCAAAIALNESKQKKVLIFSTDPAHSLSDSFGIPIGDKVTTLGKNLDGLEIDAYTLLKKFKKKYRKEIDDFFNSAFTSTTTATIDAPYDRKVMEKLIDLAPPGIDEIMALKTIMDLMQENKYDLFILDTAPTGHTIRLLEMPEVAQEWVSTLLEIEEKYPLSLEIGDTLTEMLATIKQVKKMLTDKKKSEFVLVSIPEMMSVQESSNLLARLQELKVAVKHLIINKIVADSSCSFCSVKRAEQMKYVEQLAKLGLQTVGVALFNSEIKGIKSLEKLSTSLQSRNL